MFCGSPFLDVLKFNVRPFPKQVPAPNPNGFHLDNPPEVLEPHPYGTSNCQWGVRKIDTADITTKQVNMGLPRKACCV